MINLLRIALALLLALAPATAAYAQGVPFNQIPQGRAAVTYHQLVDGTYVPASDANPLPVDATVNASVSGFAPATTGTPITADTNAETGSLPAGAVVVATNVGSSNPAYCKLGASATTSDQYISPGGGWFAFTVGAATQLTCITASSTTVINMTGGAGIATGTGGGSGGSGGGGDVTGAVAHDADGTGSDPVLTGGYASAAAPSSVSADGDAVRAWHLRNGAQATVITAAGALVGGDATNGLDVDVTRSALPSGASTSALQSSIQGVIGEAVAPASMAVAGGVYNGSDHTLDAGDSAALQLDAEGDLKVTVTNNGTAIDATIVGQTPSTVACQRLSAAPTAGTTATTGPINCNVLGYIVTTPYALPGSFVSGITASMTGTTSTAVTGMGAPGANLFNYITTVVCGNSDATVGTFVDLQDGNGGTVFATFPAAAVYGGAAVNLPVPLKQPTANTALYAVPKTTSSETVCTVIGFKGP